MDTQLTYFHTTSRCSNEQNFKVFGLSFLDISTPPQVPKPLRQCSSPHYSRLRGSCMMCIPVVFKRLKFYLIEKKKKHVFMIGVRIIFVHNSFHCQYHSHSNHHHNFTHIRASLVCVTFVQGFVTQSRASSC